MTERIEPAVAPCVEVDGRLPAPPEDDDGQLGAGTWERLLTWVASLAGADACFALDDRGLVVATRGAVPCPGGDLEVMAARLSIVLTQTLALHPEPADDSLALRLVGQWWTALRMPVLGSEQWVAVVVVGAEVPATAVRRHLRQGLLEALVGADEGGLSGTWPGAAA